MVRLTSRGDIAGLVQLPPEIVLASTGEIDRRCRAVVAGPGLGSDALQWLFDRLSDVQVPVVLDADGLDRSLIPSSMAPERRWVLTPHDGEFERLTGRAVSTSRFGAVRALARETGCVVLL
jgi:NAD(P)H-hydrate repair Nnr-like enzyme with NAD(P)H-hydrate dehydratase domain